MAGPLTQIDINGSPKGWVSARQNQRDFSPQAARSGQNVDLSDGSWKTRDGSALVSANSLPVGTVKALKQVRFPTNESSYLVAQVDYAPQWTNVPAGPSARSEHCAAWDVARGRMLVYGGRTSGGAEFDELWSYTPASTTWAQLTPTGTPPGGLLRAIAFYDATNDAFYVWGGYHSGSWMLNLWKYDCTTNAWSHLTTTGTPNTNVHGVFRTTDRTLYLYAEPNVACPKLPLATLAWSTVAVTDSTSAEHPTATNGGMRCVYDSSGDKVVAFGGGAESVSLHPTILSFSDMTWRTGAIFPATGGLIEYAAIACGGKMVCTGGRDFWGSGISAGTLQIYDISGNVWSTNIPTGTIAARVLHTMTITDTGEILVVLGEDLTGTLLSDAHWLANSVCKGVVGGASDLYASPDHLPTTTAQFTPIYQLGQGAGTISFGPLNDRLVMTEGVNKVPLVWPGCMALLPTDWAVPKAVLSTQDGTNYYDVSPQVCDKDPDTVADVGSILPKGHIDVCCEMPQVSAIYVEMKTPNTGAGVPAIYSQSKALSSEAAINQYELKSTIVSWHQDSGATGRFYNGSNVAVSIGPGNTAPDVIAGVKVEFSDSTVGYVQSITGDGTGAGAVTLSVTKASTNIGHIYGTDVQNSQVTVASSYGDMQTAVYNQTLSSTATFRQYSVRQVIKGSDISQTLQNIQLKLKSGAAVTYFGLQSIVLIACSIAPRSGSTANASSAPTNVPFSQYSGIVSVSPQITGIVVTSEALSDVTPYTLTAGVDHVVTLDFYAGSSSVPALGATAGHGGYYLCNGPCASVQNPTVHADYTAQGQVVALEQIIGTVSSAFPNVIEAATTTSVAQINIAGSQSITGIAVSATTPADSQAWFAFSFDGLATFAVFVSGAWLTIVKQVGGNWQYWTGSAYTNASANNYLQALRQAFAVAANQMSAPAIAAITSDQLALSGGLIPNVTQTMDLAMGLKAGTEGALPTVASWSAGQNIAGQIIVQGYTNGAYSSGSGWTDGTAVGGVSLAQSGVLSYNGGTFTLDYSVLNGVPGYWLRINMNGTSAGTSITRILFKAPCQPLANIGDGTPDTVNGFIYDDTSANSVQDYTSQVSDNTFSDFSTAPIPMATADYLYVGFYLLFNAVEMTPYTTNNQIVSTLSAQYWNGSAWTTLIIVDGTASADGKTLSLKGRITWSLPTDWKQNIPFDAFLSRAYWVRFSVSVALTSTTAIAECRVYSVPPALKKHKLVEVFGNRVALANRPDAPDQIDVSRQFEEYGFIGNDSGSWRVGGQDSLQVLKTAWNTLFAWKATSCHQLTGSDPSNYAFQPVESARHAPINSQCMVKGPTQAGDTDAYGLYFLNEYGAWVNSGLHTDALWNTSRSRGLSHPLNLWDTTTLPHLDLNYLHQSCGEYWPVKDWIVWAVPMDFTGSGQSTNNCLLVYDIALQCWYPPFILPFGVSALCAAYEYNANAPGKMGQVELLGGTYDGRIVRLLEPGVTDDLGTPIACYIETGWLHFGEPGTEKELKEIRMFGHTATSQPVTVALNSRTNRRQATMEFPQETRVLADLENVDDLVGIGYEHGISVSGNFHKVRLDWTGPADLYGMTLGIAGLRKEPAA